MLWNNPLKQTRMRKAVLLLTAVVVAGIAVSILVCSIHPGKEGESIWVYYGFRLPLRLSQQDVNNSLKDSKELTVENVSLEWIDLIDQMALKDGWQVLETRHFNDGGSVMKKYFKSKSNPAVQLFYKWDLNSGRYKSLSVLFIPPAKIDTWLSGIQSHDGSY